MMTEVSLADRHIQVQAYLGHLLGLGLGLDHRRDHGRDHGQDQGQDHGQGHGQGPTLGRIRGHCPGRVLVRSRRHVVELDALGQVPDSDY
jgi:hypothetical protein